MLLSKMTKYVLLLSLFNLLFIQINCLECIEVQILDGTICGKSKISQNGNKYYEFEGIPYAQPPIKELRFEEPKSIKPWIGKWICHEQSACMQFDHNTDGEYFVKGQEDCLYVNVYTPTLDPSANLDVIVFIHGGWYMFGKSTNFTAINLIDKNVVYVTMNYRLGPLGFLSTEDDVVPGNNGLKDQNLALKWIKNNINFFGGNRDSITITGRSAGGASVHFHILSPYSRGLFNKAISQSGSALNPWVLSENNLKKAQILGEKLGCPTSQGNEILLKCLKQRPALDIVQKVEEFHGFLYNPFSIFAPVVDFYSKTPFISDEPINLIKNGNLNDVPWLVSVVESEGLYPAAEFLQNENLLKEINKRWFEYAPYILDYNYTIRNEDREEVAKKIKKYYLGDEIIRKSTFNKFVNMLGDRLFVSGVFESVQQQSLRMKSQIYFYKLCYKPKHSVSDMLSKSSQNFGASHGDDSLILLVYSDEDDKKIRELLLNIWISFAKSGEPKIPNFDWKPVCDAKNKDDLTFLEILNGDNYKTISDHLGEVRFWKSLPIR